MRKFVAGSADEQKVFGYIEPVGQMFNQLSTEFSFDGYEIDSTKL